MSRETEHTLREVAAETEKLRKTLAQIAERLTRASATHQDEAARLTEHVEAISARVSALQRRAAG